MLMSTARTGLAGMPGIDFDHLDTPFLSLVKQKRIKLSKRPAMQPSLRFAFLPDFAGAANVFEVLNHDGTAGERVLRDAFGEHVITIPVEALRLTAQFPQMAASPLRSFHLHPPPQPAMTPIHF